MQQGRLRCGSMRAAGLRASQADVSGDRRAAGNLARHTHPTYCAAAHALLCPHGATPRCHQNRYRCTWTSVNVRRFATGRNPARPLDFGLHPPHIRSPWQCCQRRRNAIIGRRSLKLHACSLCVECDPGCCSFEPTILDDNAAPAARGSNTASAAQFAVSEASQKTALHRQRRSAEAWRAWGPRRGCDRMRRTCCYHHHRRLPSTRDQ